MAQYTQRTQPMHRHSKWLSKTFGDKEVMNQKCQNVCEVHIDPMFMRIIQRRQLTVTGKSGTHRNIIPGPSLVPSPGPSGITKAGSDVKTKPSREAPSRQTVAKPSELPQAEYVEFVGIPGINIKQEPLDESDLTESSVADSSTVTPGPVVTVSKHKLRARQSPRQIMDNKLNKRARIDIAKTPETSVEKVPERQVSKTLTSEFMIKSEPESDAVLLPSVFENIVVKQEALDADDIRDTVNVENESWDYKIDSIDEADKTKNEPNKPETSFYFDVPIKQENEDLISVVAKTNETTINKTDQISVSEILNDILKKKLITPNDKEMLSAHKLDISFLQNISSTASHPKLKSFAIALYLYSHKAYEYIRTVYKTCLPPPFVLTDWLVQSKGKAGFSRETLEAISAKAALTKKQKSTWHKTYVCLVLHDLKMVSKRYGRTTNKDNIINPFEYSTTVAYTALVISAVALNANWKLPIGYFWTNVVKTSERAHLVHVALNILEKVGVTPVAVTFEYNKDNLEMCADLNCCIDKADLKTYFLSESGRQIYIFPDPRGIIQTISKSIGYTESLQDESLQVVSLTQIPLLLHHCQMRFTTNQHSLRKAIAGEICKNDIFSNFEPAAGILTFLKNIHVVLDVVTSRKGGSNLKKPISKAVNVTANPTVVALQEAGKYFKSLKLNSSMLPIWETDKGIGILGLCALIDSTLMMIFKYSNEIYLEFGKFVGNPFTFVTNMTPPVYQKKKSSATYLHKKYKILLQEVAAARSSLAIENASLLTCRFAHERINQTTYIPNVNNSIDIGCDLAKVLRCQLAIYEDTFIGYIARFITYSLTNQLQCDKCIRALRSNVNKKRVSPDIQLKKHSFELKSEEPSKAVMDICRIAEAIYKNAVKECGTLNPKFNVFSLVIKVMVRFVYRPLFQDLFHHQFDTDIMNNHVVDLAKAVAESYLDTRIKHWNSNKWVF